MATPPREVLPAPTAPVRHAPAPFATPLSGDLDQRLAQIVGYINSMRSIVTTPTFDHIAMTDELGQTWLLYMQSNGSLRSVLVTR